MSPAWVDEAFPKLADICQKALNSSNNVASLIGELEVAKTAADLMKDDHADPSWKTKTVDAINAMGAPCSPYSRYIIEFVEKFTGGVDAPLVDFMDAVSKQF